jgi:hypothetical protein
MRVAFMQAGTLAFCLGLAGCGPLLDWRDSVPLRVGPNTPTGTWKRDFWGRDYFVSDIDEPKPWAPNLAQGATGAAPPQSRADPPSGTR